MQEKRLVARVEACVQNKLPQLALNFRNNSLCCSKQRKIQLTVGILSVERKNGGGGLFSFLLFPEESFTYVCFLNLRKSNKFRILEDVMKVHLNIIS